MFEGLTTWLERRRGLQELQAIEGENNEAFLGYFTEQIDLATTEFKQGRRERALEGWRKMHAQYPDLSLTSDKALNLFIDLGCHDEAEVLIQDGRRRYPRFRSVHDTAFARVAYRRGNYEEALRRYEVVRRRFPLVADGYGIAALCLIDLGRHDEADALLERGVQKLPADFDLAVRYAQAATRRLDWAEGRKRWETIRSNFEHLPGPLGIAECQRELGQFDEAESTLRAACERFPKNPWGFAELAKLFTVKGDLAEAAKHWEDVITRFPSFEFAYRRAADALRKAGRETDADDLLRVGVTRSPDDLEINVEYAKAAHRRGDWAAATERWAAVRNRFPGFAEAGTREQEALALAAEQRK